MFGIPPIFKDVTGGARFWLFTSFWILFFVAFGVLSFFLASFFNLPSISSDLYPEAVNSYKWLQLISSVGIFVLPPLVLISLFTEDPLELLKLRKRPAPFSIVLVFLVLFFSIPLLNVIIEWNKSLELPASMKLIEATLEKMEEEAGVITELFLRADTVVDLCLNLLLIAFIPAVGEELLFRGGFQNLLLSWFRNKHAAIWLAAVLFSLLHFQFYGFVPRMLLGALFGYLFSWSGSLWIPIAAHFLNNASAVTISYFSRGIKLQEEIDAIGTTSESWYYLLPSAALLSWALWFFYRENKNPAG